MRPDCVLEMCGRKKRQHEKIAISLFQVPEDKMARKNELGPLVRKRFFLLVFPLGKFQTSDPK